MKLPLIITYDDQKMQDGFGSQAIRLIGIYSICSFFKINYLHSPISVIGNRWELTGPDISEENYLKWLNFATEITNLGDSPQRIYKRQKIISEHNIGFKRLLSIAVLSVIYRAFGVRLILRLTLPFGITDRIPKIWELGAVAIRNNLKKFDMGNEKNLVIHYRTGLNSPSKSRPQLSSIYYRDTLTSMASSALIKLDSVTIHTDLYKEDINDKSSSNRVRDFLEFVDFCQNTFENVSIEFSSTILDTLRDMIKAENLVVSRSALSYFAGIVNSNRVIYPPTHGHAKLPRWITGSNSPGALRSFHDSIADVED